MNDPIETLMAEQVNKGLLKYAVSRQMFCQVPDCGAIMDMRRAVLISVKTPSGAEQDMVECATCWDTHHRDNVTRLAAARGLTLTVLDGRQLWPAKPKAKTKTKKSVLNLERVMEAAEEGDGTGFCKACGNEQDGCEPDARKYPCEACGANEVYGAQELMIMLG